MRYEIALLKVEEKDFVNDKGEKIKYLQTYTVLGNKKFVLSPIYQKDRQIYKYLVKELANKEN